MTSGIATIGLMGPRSRELLSLLTDADLSPAAFPFGWSREIAIGAATLRGQGGLHAALEEAFAGMLEDGTYDAILEDNNAEIGDIRAATE